MVYVYVLYSLKDYKFYYGRTKDLLRRFKEHNLGKVSVTKSRRPLKLIYYEAYLNEKDAVLREKNIKSGYQREQIKENLKNSIKQFGGVA